MRWSLALPCALAGLAACADVERSTVVYDGSHGAGLLDIHAPPGATAAPAVLLVHGGSWEGGERGNMAWTADRLAGLGYVAASADYRLVPSGEFPNAVHDTFCALAYLRAHADELGIDPARVAALGYSAGGHLVSLMGVAADLAELQSDACPSGRTERPAAVISFAGPTDLTRLDADVTRNFVGATLDADRTRWELASPAFHVDPGEPPFLIVHPEHDLVSPIEQSKIMVTRLRGAGNQPEFLRLEGGGHLIGDGAGLGVEQSEKPYEVAESWLVLVDFLERTIGAP